MSSITVSSTDGLYQALASAKAGDTILLQAGTYSGLRFDSYNFSSAVTITSADPNNQAVLTDFNINNAGGLTFQKVDLFANDPTGYWSFRVNSSHDITFDQVRIHGSLDNNPLNDQDGLGFWNSSNITITNSEFTELGTALSLGTNSNILIAGNYLHDLRTDAMDLSGVQNVKILNNYITEFYIATGDHPDAIQFWTSATAPTKDIQISGNVITRGAGTVGMQGIYMSTDPGTMVLENVNISDNFLVGTGYQGISILGGFNNATIANNQLYSLDNNTKLTWIRLDTGVGASVTGNAAMQIDTVNIGGVLTKTGNVLNTPTTDAGKAELDAWVAAHPEMSWVLTGALPSGGSTSATAPTPPAAPADTGPFAPAVTPPPPTNLTLNGATDTGVQGDEMTKTALVRIDGQVSEGGSTITLYSAGAAIASGTADSTGKFSVTATKPIAEGDNLITATTKSASGAVSASSEGITVTLDTQAAQSDLIDFAYSKGSGRAGTVSLSGTASDDHGAVQVDVYRDGTLIKSIGGVNGAWAMDDTAAGQTAHTYTTKATDAAGNVSNGAHSLMIGSAANETIKGNASDNFIWGNGGYDTMTGGGGNDTFVFRSQADAPMPTFMKNGKFMNIETITDFGPGDHIDFSDLGHLTFRGQSTSSPGPMGVTWYMSGGNTFVMADVTGDGRADMQIQLSGNHPLTASDFLLA